MWKIIPLLVILVALFQTSGAQAQAGGFVHECWMETVVQTELRFVYHMVSATDTTVVEKTILVPFRQTSDERGEVWVHVFDPETETIGWANWEDLESFPASSGCPVGSTSPTFDIYNRSIVTFMADGTPEFTSVVFVCTGIESDDCDKPVEVEPIDYEVLDQLLPDPPVDGCIPYMSIGGELYFHDDYCDDWDRDTRPLLPTPYMLDNPQLLEEATVIAFVRDGDEFTGAIEVELEVLYIAYGGKIYQPLPESARMIDGYADITILNLLFTDELKVVCTFVGDQATQCSE